MVSMLTLTKYPLQPHKYLEKYLANMINFPFIILSKILDALGKIHQGLWFFRKYRMNLLWNNFIDDLYNFFQLAC